MHTARNILALITCTGMLAAAPFSSFFTVQGDAGYTTDIFCDASRIADGFTQLAAFSGFNWRLADGVINRTRIDAAYMFYFQNSWANNLAADASTILELHPADSVTLTAAGGAKVFFDALSPTLPRYTTNDNMSGTGSGSVEFDIGDTASLFLSYDYRATAYWNYDLDSGRQIAWLGVRWHAGLFSAFELRAGYERADYPELHTLRRVGTAISNDTALRADNAGLLAFSFTYEEDTHFSMTINNEAIYRDSNGDLVITNNNTLDDEYYRETRNRLSIGIDITPQEGTKISIDARDTISFFPQRNALSALYAVTGSHVWKNYLDAGITLDQDLFRNENTGLSFSIGALYFRSDANDYFECFDGFDIRLTLKFWL
ncbi:MAG: hypothetical protein HZC28_00140 [Spirochaetes bacterium]|nr:hypothetical protein [Spirochaetota bacterium]